MATALPPAFVTLPALTLVGFETRFISALSPDANNQRLIPPLWDRLMERRDEFVLPPDAPAYGACRRVPADQRQRDDELLYLAGFAVNGAGPVPAAMVRWDLPPCRYAQFTHRGPISRLRETIDHALRVWLPSSDFVYVEGGADLERYDARFRGEAPESELDFLVPVGPRRP